MSISWLVCSDEERGFRSTFLLSSSENVYFCFLSFSLLYPEFKSPPPLRRFTALGHHIIPDPGLPSVLRRDVSIIAQLAYHGISGAMRYVCFVRFIFI